MFQLDLFHGSTTTARHQWARRETGSMHMEDRDAQ
jgi:hypothetical protein